MTNEVYLHNIKKKKKNYDDSWDSQGFFRFRFNEWNRGKVRKEEERKGGMKDLEFRFYYLN